MSHVRQKEAVVLIGPRRAGKTTLAKRLMQIEQGLGKQASYFDLEALGAPNSAQALEREIEKTPPKSLIVLDEAQILDGWIKVVRGQVEEGKRNIIVSGSSASLLSAEVATSLGGRAIPETILPISYSDARAWGLKTLAQYMDVGGYPECVMHPDGAARLHKTYLELTVLRDVAARKNIRETKPLSDLALILLSEPGKRISAKKTSAMLGITQPTFRSYAQGLNDAYLILSVLPYARSPRERIIADAKHYAYDTGLAKSVSVPNENFGRRLENIVALELVRRGYGISYHLDGDTECDFIAQKIGRTPLAVQVWMGEGKPPERELEGLKAGMRVAHAEGLLLSLGRAEGLPAWAKSDTIEKWLLGA